MHWHRLRSYRCLKLTDSIFISYLRSGTTQHASVGGGWGGGGGGWVGVYLWGGRTDFQPPVRSWGVCTPQMHALGASFSGLFHTAHHLCALTLCDMPSSSHYTICLTLDRQPSSLKPWILNSWGAGPLLSLHWGSLNPSTVPGTKAVPQPLAKMQA